MQKYNHLTVLEQVKRNNRNYYKVQCDCGKIEVNRFKNDYSMQQLLTFCRLILNQHGNPEPSSVNEIKVTEKVQRLDGEDSTNNPSTSAQHPKQDDDIV